MSELSITSSRFDLMIDTDIGPILQPLVSHKRYELVQQFHKYAI
jgi:hypothetical protein